MKNAGNKANSQGKLPYKKPTLTPYGSIQNITQATSGSNTDGMGGNMAPPS
ncbi:hypothetical protein [Kamptonema formosum]|uniref:hypothetical protein n=1 Tax=Kamptonema formosum TaxID=331992 RepID=UPI00034BC006|nr:hypothetical protein [Oscillatoria sp. PCC 10802]